MECSLCMEKLQVDNVLAISIFKLFVSYKEGFQFKVIRSKPHFDGKRHRMKIIESSKLVG